MDDSELTIGDALRDPMIRQVLRADRISLPAFAVFLEKAARRQQQRSAVLDFEGTTAAKRRLSVDSVN